MCSHPSKLRYGFILFNETGVIKNGTVAEFFCDKGLKLEGPSKKVCLSSGKWDPDEKVKCK